MPDTLYSIFCSNPRISTDTRSLKEGDIYFALKGDRFDGNAFVTQALEKGAAHAVVSTPELTGTDRVTVVADTLATLQQLAKHHRTQLGIPIIAITGSNGKTTTKELLATCLRQQYKTDFTRGNLNNHIGVPLTILSFDKTTEFGIVEMGANHIGEIAALCEIADPDFGVITNIGPAHLEGFGSIAGVYQAKTELYDYLRQNGRMFMNENERSLNCLAERYPERLGFSETFQWQGGSHQVELLSADPALRFSADEISYDTQLAGSYNYNNVLTALAISNYFEVPIEVAATAISQYMPANNRSQNLSYRGINVILDAYNANPGSVRSALDNVLQSKAVHKSLILGDMKELGTYSDSLHREMLDYISKSGAFERVVLIGPEYYRHQSAFPHYNFYEQLKDYQPDWPSFTGHLLLVKGSRSISLEKLFHDIDSKP